MQKTLRFAELVKTSGRPQTVTLWTDPQNDPEFSRAIRENRVLTITSQNIGTKKDAGRIGFHQERNALYLVFPDELPQNPDARVVGIKYEAVEQPKTSQAGAVEFNRQRLPSTALKLGEPSVEKVTPKREPKLKKFSAVIRRTMTWERSIQFQARDRSAARKMAERLSAEEVFDTSDVITRNEVRHIEEES